MDYAISYASRVSIIASVPTTLQDTKYILEKASEKREDTVTLQLVLEEHLMQLMTIDG